MEIQKDPNSQIQTNDENVGQVSLPFNETQFKDFIVSLLGKPQTITKRFRGSFELTKDNIITLFELLNQRVFQQNDAKLIQFRATVYYDDNSTVTLTGFEHLVHYNEPLPVVSKGIHLTWQYLIKFRDKGTFEKQEINLSFVTEMDGRINIDEEMQLYAHDNHVFLRIHHTARTWGADIEGILTKHIKTLVKKDSKFTIFFRYNTERVQNSVSGLLALITMTFAGYKTYKLRSANLTFDSSFWLHHYGNLLFLFLGTFILLKLTLILLEEFEIYGRPSFILLTSESLKDKEKTLKSYRFNWRKYIWTIIGSLLLGVIGNYIYSLLTGK